jgi:hypothetical protein
VSTAAAHAAAFYREVAKTRTLWTINDAGGFPAPKTTAGRAQPIWSSRSRAERIIASVPAYGAFEPVKVPWKEFAAKWVPGLTEDGIHIGLNWSGPRATGYDLTPEEVVRNVEAVASIGRK